MSFKRYEQYKSVGLGWLGNVPATWRVHPFWTLFRRVKRDGFGTEQLLSVYRDFGVIPKASRDDNFNNASDDLNTYQLVEPGDLAINKMKAWQGSVGISEHRGIVSPAYFVYRAKHQEDNQFLHYLFRSPEYTAGYLSLSKGIRVNQWDLDPEYHSRIPVLLPSKNEQEAIVAFLDHETAKTDALVEEQKRLIELLKEKRQAVITRAVTKGLNPNAPMKPSGVEWLGNVPVHWEVLRGRDMGYLFGSESIADGAVVDEGAVPFLKVASLSPEDLEIASWDWFVEETVARPLRCRNNFVVFPKRGAAIFSNKVNVVTRPSLIDPNLMGWEVVSRIAVRFLAYCLKARGLSELADVSTVPQINNKHILPEKFPVPPKPEQDAIAAHLDKASLQLGDLIAEAEEGIKLLHERRSALVSAAVTGKIDVRGLVPKEAVAA